MQLESYLALQFSSFIDYVIKCMSGKWNPCDIPSLFPGNAQSANQLRSIFLLLLGNFFFDIFNFIARFSKSCYRLKLLTIKLNPF